MSHRLCNSKAYRFSMCRRCGSINNYPQQVEFIRNDTGEHIYQSKAIPVGSKIERAALDVELPAGTYECTAMFHNLDPVSGEIIGTAGAIITITIKN